MALHTLSLPLKMITALAGSAASAATLSYTAGLTRVSACTFAVRTPHLPGPRAHSPESYCSQKPCLRLAAMDNPTAQQHC